MRSSLGSGIAAVFAIVTGVGWEKLLVGVASVHVFASIAQHSLINAVEYD